MTQQGKRTPKEPKGLLGPPTRSVAACQETRTEHARSIDWQAIADAWRIGQFSIRLIARIHGVSDTAIRKRAARDGWPPYGELAPEVRRRVREILAAEGEPVTAEDEAQWPWLAGEVAPIDHTAERWPWLMEARA